MIQKFGTFEVSSSGNVVIKPKGFLRSQDRNNCWNCEYFYNNRGFVCDFCYRESGLVAKEYESTWEELEEEIDVSSMFEERMEQDEP